MPTSFSTALAGLTAFSAGVDVIGNNLANLTTVGYKASRATFRDMVAQSFGAANGTGELGLGAAPPLVSRQFTQGTIQSTGGSLDAAIQGDGFFIVRNPAAGGYYTRAGNFQVDAEGFLTTQNKERVQGWGEIAGRLNTSGAIGDIVLPIGTAQAASVTTQFSFDMNLNAGSKEGDQFASRIEVFDSLGASHILTLTFTRSATANQWDYSITIPGADVGSADATLEVKAGSLVFDSFGKLTDPTANVDDLAITGLVSGAADMDLTWQLFSTGNTAKITQFSQVSAVSANTQNGSPAAQLIKITLEDDGKLIAQFSSGQQRMIGQLAVASIRNPESLRAVGNNNYSLTVHTSTPAVGLPASGGRGKVIGGALEGSTVDIAREFTTLITMQRGYQANSRVITTTDELSQETLNLKR